MQSRATRAERQHGPGRFAAALGLVCVLLIVATGCPSTKMFRKDIEEADARIEKVESGIEENERRIEETNDRVATAEARAARAEELGAQAIDEATSVRVLAERAAEGPLLTEVEQEQGAIREEVERLDNEMRSIRSVLPQEDQAPVGRPVTEPPIIRRLLNWAVGAPSRVAMQERALVEFRASCTVLTEQLTERLAETGSVETGSVEGLPRYLRVELWDSSEDWTIKPDAGPGEEKYVDLDARAGEQLSWAWSVSTPHTGQHSLTIRLWASNTKDGYGEWWFNRDDPIEVEIAVVDDIGRHVRDIREGVLDTFKNNAVLWIVSYLTGIATSYVGFRTARSAAERKAGA